MRVFGVLVITAALACSSNGADKRADAGDAGGGCTTLECGPTPQNVSTIQCADGSVAGPLCSRYPSGKCAWSLTVCPGATSCTGEACGPSFPGGFCFGLGNEGNCKTSGGACSWEITCS